MHLSLPTRLQVPCRQGKLNLGLDGQVHSWSEWGGPVAWDQEPGGPGETGTSHSRDWLSPCCPCSYCQWHTRLCQWQQKDTQAQVSKWKRRWPRTNWPVGSSHNFHLTANKGPQVIHQWRSSLCSVAFASGCTVSIPTQAHVGVSHLCVSMPVCWRTLCNPLWFWTIGIDKETCLARFGLTSQSTALGGEYIYIFTPPNEIALGKTSLKNGKTQLKRSRGHWVPLT